MVDQKLYSLLKVYESGSFSIAARQLSITQPAVSQHIRALEQELNVRIFERGNGKLYVTKQGEKVIRCAQKIVGLTRQLEQELSDGRDMIDHLTVGVTHTAESNPIAEALARYCDVNSSISIKIITMPINNLYKMLKTYEIDIAIVEDRIKDPALKFLPVDTDYLVLAVSMEHPFAKRSMITLEELKQERLILRLPNSGTRNLFVAHLESNHMSISDFNVILELDNVATIKDLVRRNFGVSILPKSACLDEVKQKTMALLPIENLSMMREINIAYQSDFSQTDILRGVIDAYNETLQAYR
ncbi:MAG: LysR family transcriptional regulator [Oscillospiraceae bacterium]|nr:LysR family transcriptional regulator [Oscillospiraceae bacterium]